MDFADDTEQWKRKIPDEPVMSSEKKKKKRRTSILKQPLVAVDQNTVEVQQQRRKTRRVSFAPEPDVRTYERNAEEWKDRSGEERPTWTVLGDMQGPVTDVNFTVQDENIPKEPPKHEFSMPSVDVDGSEDAGLRQGEMGGDEDEEYQGDAGSPIVVWQDEEENQGPTNLSVIHESGREDESHSTRTEEPVAADVERSLAEGEMSFGSDPSDVSFDPDVTIRPGGNTTQIRLSAVVVHADTPPDRESNHTMVGGDMSVCSIQDDPQPPSPRPLPAPAPTHIACADDCHLTLGPADMEGSSLGEDSVLVEHTVATTTMRLPVQILPSPQEPSVHENTALPQFDRTIMGDVSMNESLLSEPTTTETSAPPPPSFQPLGPPRTPNRPGLASLVSSAGINLFEQSMCEDATTQGQAAPAPDKPGLASLVSAAGINLFEPSMCEDATTQGQPAPGMQTIMDPQDMSEIADITEFREDISMVNDTPKGFKQQSFFGRGTPKSATPKGVNATRYEADDMDITVAGNATVHGGEMDMYEVSVASPEQKVSANQNQPLAAAINQTQYDESMDQSMTNQMSPSPPCGANAANHTQHWEVPMDITDTTRHHSFSLPFSPAQGHHATMYGGDMEDDTVLKEQTISSHVQGTITTAASPARVDSSLNDSSLSGSPLRPLVNEPRPTSVSRFASSLTRTGLTRPSMEAPASPQSTVLVEREPTAPTPLSPPPAELQAAMVAPSVPAVTTIPSVSPPRVQPSTSVPMFSSMVTHTVNPPAPLFHTLDLGPMLDPLPPATPPRAPLSGARARRLNPTSARKLDMPYPHAHTPRSATRTGTPPRLRHAPLEDALSLCAEPAGTEVMSTPYRMAARGIVGGLVDSHDLTHFSLDSPTPAHPPHTPAPTTSAPPPPKSFTTPALTAPPTTTTTTTFSTPAPAPAPAPATPAVFRTPIVTRATTPRARPAREEDVGEGVGLLAKVVEHLGIDLILGDPDDGNGVPASERKAWPDNCLRYLWEGPEAEAYEKYAARVHDILKGARAQQAARLRNCGDVEGVMSTLKGLLASDGPELNEARILLQAVQDRHGPRAKAVMERMQAECCADTVKCMQANEGIMRQLLHEVARQRDRANQQATSRCMQTLRSVLALGKTGDEIRRQIRTPTEIEELRRRLDALKSEHAQRVEVCESKAATNNRQQTENEIVKGVQERLEIDEAESQLLASSLQKRRRELQAATMTLPCRMETHTDSELVFVFDIKLYALRFTPDGEGVRAELQTRGEVETILGAVVDSVWWGHVLGQATQWAHVHTVLQKVSALLLRAVAIRRDLGLVAGVRGAKITLNGGSNGVQVVMAKSIPRPFVRIELTVPSLTIHSASRPNPHHYTVQCTAGGKRVNEHVLRSHVDTCVAADPSRLLQRMARGLELYLGTLAI